MRTFIILMLLSVPAIAQELEVLAVSDSVQIKVETREAIIKYLSTKFIYADIAAVINLLSQMKPVEQCEPEPTKKGKKK